MVERVIYYAENKMAPVTATLVATFLSLATNCCAGARTGVISNVEPRRTITGDIVNVRGGCVRSCARACVLISPRIVLHDCMILHAASEAACCMSTLLN